MCSSPRDGVQILELVKEEDRRIFERDVFQVKCPPGCRYHRLASILRVNENGGKVEGFDVVGVER